jgi:large subunit ribosomal protein L9
LQIAEAHAKAAKLDGASVTIRAKTIDGEKLYGSVTAAEIVAALQAQGVAIDRAQVELAEPLKQTGAVDVTIRLPPEVAATVKVWIVKE